VKATSGKTLSLTKLSTAAGTHRRVFELSLVLPARLFVDNQGGRPHNSIIGKPRNEYSSKVALMSLLRARGNESAATQHCKHIRFSCLQHNRHARCSSNAALQFQSAAATQQCVERQQQRRAYRRERSRPLKPMFFIYSQIVTRDPDVARSSGGRGSGQGGS
jgi:hypothetical protein